MQVQRYFTTKDSGPYAGIEFRTTSSEIRNPDGSLVFSHDSIDVPADWSQVACDVLAQKYFRKAGIPAAAKKIEENDVPSWLWRSVPDEKKLAKLPEDEQYRGENSAQEVFHRLAGRLATDYGLLVSRRKVVRRTCPPAKPVGQSR